MKKNKALMVLAMILGGIMLNACKKEKQQNQPIAPAESITANVDGVATIFNIHASGGSTTVHDTIYTAITGTAANSDIITITIRGPLVAGKTYNAATTPDLWPFLGYTSGVHDFSNDPNSVNKVNVWVSSVSQCAISGTFSGSVIETFGDDNAPAKKSITNGKFNVSIY